jgi:homoserine O-acetyltransferase
MTEVKYYNYDKDFDLERGGKLSGFTLCFSTLGRLNSDRTNVVWVCHALTGSSNVLDWWAGLFGGSQLFDPEEYFIICANMLGGCYGSTGPLSIDPNTDQPYYHDFPKITNLDIVKSFDLLRLHLGIPTIDTIIGGSMGGQQALEWCLYRPATIRRLVGLATNARHSPWGIAFNESQRMAIESDPTWIEKSEKAGLNGMSVARSVALLSYRAYDIYKHRQTDENDLFGEFRASSYQRYQGDKLVQRFNAFSYWVLSEAMDAHNVGRNRDGIEAALKTIDTECFFIGIDSDILFPVKEQEYMARLINQSNLKVIKSDFGHDGFLIETDQITNTLRYWGIV